METTLEGRVLFNLLTNPDFWDAFTARTTTPAPAPTEQRLQVLFRDGFFSSAPVAAVVAESEGKVASDRLFDAFTDLDFWAALSGRTYQRAPTPTEPRLEHLFGRDFFTSAPVEEMVNTAIEKAIAEVQLVGVAESYAHTGT